MIEGAQNINLYSSITSKKLANPKDYLVNAYSPDRLQYYNAETNAQKKNRKSNIIKYIAIVSSTLLILGAGILTVVSGNKNSKYFIDWANFKLKDKISSAMSNFTNIKDDLWDRFAKKAKKFQIFNFHPMKWIDDLGEKITGFYHNAVKKSFKNEWNSKRQQMIDNGIAESSLPDKFETWYDNITQQIHSRVHGDENRVTKDLNAKNFIDKFFGGNIADEKLTDVIQGTYKEVPMSSGDNKLIQEYNEYQKRITEKIIAKQRDICIGSAPTDVLTQITSLGLLGVAVKHSDTKEEKRSIVINLGIPLLTALGTTTYATLRALSGAKALGAGLILGEIASLTANKLSKLYLKHKGINKEDKQNIA